MLIAPPVAGYSERVYQVFGKEVLDQLIPIAAVQALERMGLPQPAPWRRTEERSAGAPSASSTHAPAREPPETEEMSEEATEEAPSFGECRVHGFVSKPETQKLNRNSIYVFVNRRLIRDRLIQHAITEAYRNILPPTVYPVVLLFLDLPGGEVDVNVHPSKTEVRFRQQSVMHDFVRDSVRAALMKARPVPQFAVEISAHPSASPSLTPGARFAGAEASSAWRSLYTTGVAQPFSLQAPVPPPITKRFQFGEGISVEGNTALSLARDPEPVPSDGCAPPLPDEAEPPSDLAPALASLKPLGQIRDSFILAVNGEGLWIVDQHVAHERVLFEKILKQRAAQKVESQRLLLPLVLELTPAQQAVWAEISDELARNGFEVEPFGARSIAVKIAPAGVEASAVEHMLHELLDHLSREEQALNLEKIRGRIAASIACHAAIKINMPLEQNKMEWLLAELAKTDCPMTCPHGRPVVLRYSMKDIQKAFKRI
jgi:DNA mismatch repair protein MutL